MATVTSAELGYRDNGGAVNGPAGATEEVYTVTDVTDGRHAQALNGNGDLALNSTFTQANINGSPLDLRPGRRRLRQRQLRLHGQGRERRNARGGGHGHLQASPSAISQGW